LNPLRPPVCWNFFEDCTEEEKTQHLLRANANPIAAGAPSGKAHPFLMDMSTTIIARGKLRLGKLTPKCPIID
jgi:hypothetical protein